MNTCGTLKRHKMVITSYIHSIEFYNSTWYFSYLVRLRKIDRAIHICAKVIKTLV